MNWVSLELILLSENLLIPIIDILGVLLEQVVNSDVEIFMSLYSISIMENIFGQLTVLDIHILEPVSVFLSQKLIKEDLFEIDSLDIEERNHTVKVSLEADIMVGIPMDIINIDLLLDDNLWISHFGDQVQGNILEAQEASKVEWGPALLIPLDKKLQNVILALNKLGIIRWVILRCLVIESLNDCGQVSLVSVHKNTLGPGESLSFQLNHFIYFLFFRLLAFFVHFEFF